MGCSCGSLVESSCLNGNSTLDSELFCYGIGNQSFKLQEALGLVLARAPACPIDLKVFSLDPNARITDALRPSAENLVILRIEESDNFDTAQFADLTLPNIQRLSFYSCKRLKLRSSSLGGMQTLRVLEVNRVTFDIFDADTFSVLPSLKTFFTTYGLEYNSDRHEIEEMKRLHCGKEFKWLRDHLKANPYLIAPRQAGEVYNYPWSNYRWELRFMFDAVDCSRADLQGLKNQTEFSVGLSDAV